MDELWKVTHMGKSHKSPGVDRICLEIYKLTWDATKT